jgi:osmotically-inducible protein OsmY
MQKIKGLRLVIGACIVAASMNAWSQSGQAPSAASAPPGASAMVASSAAPAETGRRANRALRRQIYAAISKHKEISAGNISVTAKNGAVTLNGTVENASQVVKVAEIATGVAGVTSVNNRLAIRKPAFGAQ